MLRYLSGISGFVVLFFILTPLRVGAQTGVSLTLNVPETGDFPRISAYLNVADANGGFIHNLQVGQVSIIEEGNTQPVSKLKELRPGVQIVVAINPGPSFGIRNNKAISRYDLVKEALRGWAVSRLGSNIDDWSLLVTNGPAVSHVSDPGRWIEVLNEDQVDARVAVPSLDTLYRAVSLAADPSMRPAMGRAVLFITPPLEGQADQSLDNLISQAQQQQVQIFVWMVASPGAFATQSADKLKELAIQTRGQLFAYTGEEEIASPEGFLAPLRYVYQLEYSSRVTTGGQHQIVARLQNGEEQVESNPQVFEIDIQPPQPAFVSPPLQIKRSPTGETDADQEKLAETLSPMQQVIQVIYDFPDGRKREIVQSALLVNGEPVVENLQPPFDQFIWKLDAYTTDSIQQIKVMATDNLGLTGNSLEIPVRISVEYPEKDPWGAFQANIPILATMAAVLAGAILLLVLVLGGWLRPASLRASQNRRRKFDPVTQPVTAQNEPSAYRLSSWVNRLQWPQRHVAPKAYAFLNHIADGDNPSTAPPIPITTNELTLGSDPGRATLVLDDPSVETLHARLLRDENGIFRIKDEGSIAGTWVNYTPISREGTRLEHGDLVHIGRIGFRFTLRQITQARKPVITPENQFEETLPR